MVKRSFYSLNCLEDQFIVVFTTGIGRKRLFLVPDACSIRHIATFAIKLLSRPISRMKSDC